MHLTTSLTIDRPVPEVFAFVSDATNEPGWVSGAVERRQVTEGPIGVGTRIEGTDRIAGRNVSHSQEIVGFEQDRLVTTKVSAPWKVTYELLVAPDDGGTLLSCDATGQPSGLLTLLRLVPAAVTQRQFEQDYARLKERLERPGG